MIELKHFFLLSSLLAGCGYNKISKVPEFDSIVVKAVDEGFKVQVCFIHGRDRLRRLEFTNPISGDLTSVSSNSLWLSTQVWGECEVSEITAGSHSPEFSLETFARGSYLDSPCLLYTSPSPRD